VPYSHQKKQTIQENLGQDVVGIDPFLWRKMGRCRQEILNEMLETKQVIVVLPKIKRALQRFLHVDPRRWMFQEILDALVTELFVIVFLDPETVLTKENQHQTQCEEIIP